jgi:death-on-curing protein
LLSSQNEPRWLEPDEVIELNRLIVDATGEPFLVRDYGLLASALAKPIQYWSYEHEDDAVTLAVTLLFGIAQNHPFEQGNKRTAFEAALPDETAQDVCEGSEPISS